MATEKRLIDANALINEGYKVTMLDVFPNWLLMSDEAKEAVCKHGAYLKKIIQQLPTVDAEPVKHGCWGEFEVFNGAASLNGYPCSACGKRVYTRTNYCPNCGAKMDGDGNA